VVPVFAPGSADRDRNARPLPRDLAHAAQVAGQVADGSVEAARGARLVFNDRLDAAIAAGFMVVTLLVVLASAREWLLVLTRRRPAVVKESPFVETAYAG